MNRQYNQQENPGFLIFDSENPYLLAIQRLLACPKPKKIIKKSLHKDQWLEIQNRISEDSNFWFWCEERAKDYSVGKQGIAHWMDAVLDEEAHQGWLGVDDPLIPKTSPADARHPPANAGMKKLEDYDPATVPGCIRDNNQLELGVNYDDLKQWGFTDERIAGLKPAPARGVLPELTAQEIFDEAGIAWPESGGVMDAPVPDTGTTGESSDTLSGDG
jgi:hypothetical protein